MKTIDCGQIKEAVAGLCPKANLYLPKDVSQSIKDALVAERSPLGQTILADILKNHAVAGEEALPLCQDTGLAVVFIELGQDVHITGGLLTDAVNQGIAQGYTEHYLRKSVVAHPFKRTNTGDNTPAIIHTQLCAGDNLKITLMPKGGGAENYSALAMLTPAQGLEGAKEFIIEAIHKAGPNACPPYIIGVGIGGNFELAPLLAKKALGRTIGQHHPLADIAQLEYELLQAANNLNIGPQGLGGHTTALNIAIEIHPCHIASLPVAVNINCHVGRHQSITL